MMKSEPRKKDTPEQFLMASWVKEAGFGSILEQDFEPYVVDIYIPDLLLFNLGRQNIGLNCLAKVLFHFPKLFSLILFDVILLISKCLY